jgi:hypothetical protein
MRMTNREINQHVSNIIKIFELSNKNNKSLNDENALIMSIKQIMKVNNEYDKYYDVILHLLETSKLVNVELAKREYNPCILHMYFMNVKRFQEITLNS